MFLNIMWNSLLFVPKNKTPKFTGSIYATGAAHHSTGTCTHLYTKLYTPPPPNAGVRLFTKRKV